MTTELTVTIQRSGEAATLPTDVGCVWQICGCGSAEYAAVQAALRDHAEIVLAPAMMGGTGHYRFHVDCGEALLQEILCKAAWRLPTPRLTVQLFVKYGVSAFSPIPYHWSASPAVKPDERPGKLTLDRWLYLFEAELQHSRRQAGLPDRFSAVVAGVAALTESVTQQPSTVAVLQAAVQLAVAAYRLAAEGDPTLEHEFQYAHYQQFDLHSLVTAVAAEET